MGFQTHINQYPAPAVEGDFASANPHTSVLAGPGRFIAGEDGLIIGRFAWADASGCVGNAGIGVPNGFIHRDMQAVYFNLLDEQTMTIPPGFMVTVHNGGDFWARTGATATVGQKVFASLTTGQVETGEAGSTIAGYIETKWTVASAASAGELIKISSWV